MNRKNMFGAITLAMALFFFWPAVYGSYQEMRALQDARDGRQTMLDARKATLKKVNDEYAKYQTLLSSDIGQSFSQFVPVKKNTAELISATQDIAQSSGVQLSQLQIAEVKGKEADPYKTLAITMEMSGSYQALRSFLTNLEQNVRVLNVSSIEISSGDSSAQLKFVVKADTYFLK